MSEEILQLSNISKTFPGVKALDGISFGLRLGEVHCICGENGAGKSTLIKIISGAYQPDPGGLILFEGEPVSLDPYKAIKLGIQTIYQEHTIFPHLNITENIFAGMEITRNGIVHKVEMQERTAEVLRYLHSDLKPDQLVDELSSGEQKIVEIAKALVLDRKVIIMDEPTSSFSLNEIDNLLEIIKKIRDKGIGVIYISHHLEEVFRIGDRITILRDGKHVKTCNSDEIDEAQLIHDMVGRDVTTFYHREFFQPGETALKVEGLSGNGVTDVSFEVRRGEIVGFAGMEGSGRSELMTLLFGGAEKLSGKVFVFGKEVNFKNPGDAIKNKMCYITEDRQSTGLFLIHTVARNIIVASLVNTNGLYLSPKQENEIGNEFIKRLGIKAANSQVLVMNLSGGNQQKVILAKWFNTNGEIFIFDEPTRGIDVGAKQEIYQIMTDLLREGKAIIMASSDMPEIISMSDRVMVMRKGRIVAELSRDEVTEENILEYSIGGRKI